MLTYADVKLYMQTLRAVSVLLTQARMATGPAASKLLKLTKVFWRSRYSVLCVCVCVIL